MTRFHREDRGSVTFWVLGLTISIVAFGGVALDFWRALAVQRAVAAIADAGVAAAASGIDEIHYRTTGEVKLDEDRAVLLGTASVESQETVVSSVLFDVAPNGARVDIVVVAEIDSGFVAFFAEDGRLEIRATASAEPRLIP